MTLTGLLLTLIPLALVLAMVVRLRRRRDLRMPLRRWLAWLVAGSFGSALLLALVGAGGISGVDWGQTVLVALGSLALGLLATTLVYAWTRPDA